MFLIRCHKDLYRLLQTFLPEIEIINRYLTNVVFSPRRVKGTWRETQDVNFAYCSLVLYEEVE